MDLKKYHFLCNSNLSPSVLWRANLADKLINVPNIETSVSIKMHYC